MVFRYMLHKARATLTAVALITLGAAPAQAAQTPTPTLGPSPYQEPRAIIGDALRSMSPYAVDELRAVEIGGIPQWISVRGRDRRNPILLFVHGGPASTEMPVSWLYQRPWEDFFTVVQWDQRGAGKTAARTDNRVVMPTVTMQRMILDGEEMVSHLRRHYGKQKIFVIGHSWGSVIGLEVARRRPEWLHAYVGMGQLLAWSENERLGYAFAMDEARRERNAKALAELTAIAPYPPTHRPATLEEVITQRNWVIHYGGLTAGRSNFAYDLNARKLSPHYTDQDLRPSGFIDGEALERLLPDLTRMDLRTITKLNVPIFIFAGRRDYQTPSQIAAAWIERLDAPEKRLFWFEHSAHMMQLEQPGQVLLHLVQHVRPIAERVEDAAPDDAPGVALDLQ